MLNMTIMAVFVVVANKMFSASADNWYKFWKIKKERETVEKKKKFQKEKYWKKKIFLG